MGTMALKRLLKKSMRKLLDTHKLIFGLYDASSWFKLVYLLHFTKEVPRQ